MAIRATANSRPLDHNKEGNMIVTNLDNVSTETLFALMRKEAALDKKKKEAAAAVTAHRRTIKALTGINIKNFLAVYNTHMDGDDSFIEDLREQQRIAQKMGMPLGHQFNILDEIEAQRARKEAQKDGDDKSNSSNYFQQGLRALLMGKEEGDCPHTSGTAMQEWLQGYRYAEEHAGKGDQAIRNFENEDEDEEPKDGQEEAPKEEKKTARKRTVKRTKKAVKKAQDDTPSEDEEGQTEDQ